MTTPVKATRIDCFPTSVWQFDEPEATLSNSLTEHLRIAIEHERSVDPVGMKNRSSVLGWHSKLDLHLRDNFKPFVEIMNRNLSAIIQFERWDLSKVTPIIVECWAVVNGPQGSNQFHRHPHSHLSGVYYVQAPPNSGAIVFRDPRPVVGMMAPPVSQRTNWNQPALSKDPQAGRMLIFPSWLEHGVAANESGQDRIAISFNATFRAKAPESRRGEGGAVHEPSAPSASLTTDGEPVPLI